MFSFHIFEPELRKAVHALRHHTRAHHGRVARTICTSVRIFISSNWRCSIGKPPPPIAYLQPSLYSSIFLGQMNAI